MSNNIHRAYGGRKAIGLVAALAAIVLIVTLAVFALQAARVGGAGPRIAVDQEKIDFGVVTYGKRVRAVFTLTNLGDQSLLLADTQVPVKLLEGC